jgi:hypothetical protein
MSIDFNQLSTSVEQLQNVCVARATGGADDPQYQLLRESLLRNPRVADRLPGFIHTNRTSAQFWQFIKHTFPSYAERRTFIWSEFNPLLESLEQSGRTPTDDAVTAVLPELSSDYVHELWQRALERRTTNLDGAITLARTLLESVCKHILDDLQIAYDAAIDLPKLYQLTATQLMLAPSQHTEETFRRILGGCTSVVEGLGSLRNRISDAHGQGTKTYRPSGRHAELAVNLAGTMSMFLVSTWVAHKENTKK